MSEKGDRLRLVSSRDVAEWPTVEVPVPDLMGRPIEARQAREAFASLGLDVDNGTPLGDWLGAVCDAIERTEWHH